MAKRKTATQPGRAGRTLKSASRPAAGKATGHPARTAKKAAGARKQATGRTGAKRKASAEDLHGTDHRTPQTPVGATGRPYDSGGRFAIARTRSTTSSMLRPVVSITRASAATTSGATARVRSESSRAAISEVTFAMSLDPLWV